MLIIHDINSFKTTCTVVFLFQHMETARGSQQKLKEVSMNATEELKTAIRGVQKLFNVDADLVCPGAAMHHVQVTQGDMITPLSEGNYNARIPSGSQKEIEAVRQAKTIAFLCEDFR